MNYNKDFETFNNNNNQKNNVLSESKIVNSTLNENNNKQKYTDHNIDEINLNKIRKKLKSENDVNKLDLNKVKQEADLKDKNISNNNNHKSDRRIMSSRSNDFRNNTNKNTIESSKHERDYSKNITNRDQEMYKDIIKDYENEIKKHQYVFENFQNKHQNQIVTIQKEHENEILFLESRYNDYISNLVTANEIRLNKLKLLYTDKEENLIKMNSDKKVNEALDELKYIEEKKISFDKNIINLINKYYKSDHVIEKNENKEISNKTEINRLINDKSILINGTLKTIQEKIDSLTEIIDKRNNSIIINSNNNEEVNNVNNLNNRNNNNNLNEIKSENKFFNIEINELKKLRVNLMEESILIQTENIKEEIHNIPNEILPKLTILNSKMYLKKLEKIQEVKRKILKFDKIPEINYPSLFDKDKFLELKTNLIESNNISQTRKKIVYSNLDNDLSANNISDNANNVNKIKDNNILGTSVNRINLDNQKNNVYVISNNESNNNLNHNNAHSYVNTNNTNVNLNKEKDNLIMQENRNKYDKSQFIEFIKTDDGNIGNISNIPMNIDNDDKEENDYLQGFHENVDYKNEFNEINSISDNDVSEHFHNKKPGLNHIVKSNMNKNLNNEDLLNTSSITKNFGVKCKKLILIYS